MRRKTTIILTALIMACSATACQRVVSDVTKNVIENNKVSNDSKEAAEPDVPEETSSAEPELSSEEQEEQEQELYNAYIDVNNLMVGRVSDSLERYFDYVDIEQEEFALLDADDDYFDCYSISEYDIKDVENAYGLVNQKTDKSALDTAFLKMYPSLSQIMSTLNEIEVYTDMKSYLDDDYGKAQEYHTALMNALVDYVDDGDAFMAELDIVAEERQEKAYEQMKEQGLEVFYAMNRVLDLGNDIVDELYEQGVWDENILDMDLEKIQPLYDEFVQNVDALMEYDKDEEKLASEGITKYGWWDSFIRDLKDTKVSLTEVIQKVKNGEELSQFDMNSHFAGDCSMSSFEAGLSSLINDYNNIINVG